MANYKTDYDFSDHEDGSFKYDTATNIYSSSDDDSSSSSSSAPTKGNSSLSASWNTLEKVESSIDNSSKVRLNQSIESLSALSEENESINNASESDDENDEDNYFFHIAFTPTECTVICASKLMDTFFKEALSICKELNYEDVKLVDKKFLTLQIDSDGSFDNRLRILELTKPLSENNISLFFLSSHFSDIVLTPYELKEEVIEILRKKNFDFSGTYASTQRNLNSETLDEGFIEERKDTESSSRRIEENAFRLFKEANIKPKINDKIKLLLTGARSGEVNNAIMKTAKIISSNTIPDYFAITRTSINEVSLLLPRSSRKRSFLGFESKNIIGSTQDIIVPITIDFHKLPLDSTGIVAGLASRLINGIKLYPHLTSYPFEMNYLSMARSGIIMIPQENIQLISEVLNNIDYDKVDSDLNFNQLRI